MCLYFTYKPTDLHTFKVINLRAQQEWSKIPYYSSSIFQSFLLREDWAKKLEWISLGVYQEWTKISN